MKIRVSPFYVTLATAAGGISMYFLVPFIYFAADQLGTSAKILHETFERHTIEMFLGILGGILGFTFAVYKSIIDYMTEIKTELGSVAYLGFSTLLQPDLATGLTSLDKRIRAASSETGPYRGMIFDFLIRSLHGLGGNGFANFNVTVDEYVKYIAEIVRNGRIIVMTCFVRPFWFVTDGITGVSVEPYEEEEGKYGKGEHLGLFRNGGGKYQRCVIVDEQMIADVLLTAFLDKALHDSASCPLCRPDGPCSIHAERTDMISKENNFDANSTGDLPEIEWFHELVNKRRGIDIIYTFLPGFRKRTHQELEDRVYSSDPAEIDVRFSFFNLQRGVLRIRWGRYSANSDSSYVGALPLAWIPTEKLSNPTGKHFKIDPLTGKVSEDDGKGHRFYGKFRQVVERLQNSEFFDDRWNEMQAHLTSLVGESNRQSNESAPEIKIIAGKLPKIIPALIAEIANQGLLRTYDDLVQFYKGDKTVPRVFYAVFRDSDHPRHPVRRVSWQENWKSIANEH